MMKDCSQSSISLQDPTTRRSRVVIAGTNILWSSGTAWNGVIAEAYRFEKVETPEFQTVDHSVVLHLSSPALIELKTDGRYDSRKRISGDLSIFPAATVCQVRSAEAHDVLVISVPQQVLAQSGFELRHPGPFKPDLCAYLRDAQLEHICRALKAEAESNYLSGPLYGDSLALALGAYLLSQYSGRKLSPGYKGGIAPQALRRVIDHIESNLDSPLRMASLAEIAGLSQYRFAHNFRSAIGLPPYKYVLRARLARAKRMLRETNLPILEIAYSVGCQSSSRFHSLFRRETGTIPSAYRASFQ
jgi:AraC family transcriptional regulator